MQRDADDGPVDLTSWRSFLEQLSTLEDHTLARAYGAACALIAHADGWPTLDERRRMLGLIRRTPDLGAVGAVTVERAFQEASDWLVQDTDAGERRALMQVMKVAGREREARWLVEACCAIAAADGGYDAEEREVAIRICEALGLSATDFDLSEVR